MSLKNLKLNTSQTERPIDPIKIFQKLTLRGTIENIWGPQQSALEEWHTHRTKSDTVLQMNTGGGKTLVGLLMAQSLLNETNGQVLYVCSKNQLIEQTIKKAEECGFYVASRYAGKWTNKHEFDTCQSFCITNYDTVFNGLSSFRNTSLDALILDDAHVAEEIIRNQFTLFFKTDDALFSGIIDIFKDYFIKGSYSPVLQDVLAGKWDALLYVPMFVVNDRSDNLRTLLVDEKIEFHENSKYAWQYLKDKLNICTVILSGKGISITPPIIPIHTLPFFGKKTRRLYLTATMPKQPSFIRTFGVTDINVISPKGKSGDAQRLFVFLNSKDEKKEALDIIGKRKACVISPSYNKASEWDDVGTIFMPDDTHSKIEKFSKAKDGEILVLVARYDGIDLPGNACKILTLDRLPTGEHLFNYFLDQGMHIDTLRASHTATRVIQAIGRIFRSNTDHGVVLLKGDDLKQWLKIPRNQKLLPKLLQQQIQFSLALYEAVENGDVTYRELVDSVINGSNDWDKLYKEQIGQYHISDSDKESLAYHSVLLKEKQAYTELWNGQYQKAYKLYSEAVNDAKTIDERLAAWYLHWCAESAYLNCDSETALHLYIDASKVRIELGRPSIPDLRILDTAKVKAEFQAKKIADQFAGFNLVKVLKQLKNVEVNLNYGADTKNSEEAIKALADFLGLQGDRPDRKSDSGPDVLWIGEGDIFGVCFELKTNKRADGTYSKDNIKDCNDHHQWLHTNYNGKTFIECLVGRNLRVLNEANPHPTLRVITIESLHDLIKRVERFYNKINTMSKDNFECYCERWLQFYGLKWPDCIEALPYNLAVDLKE